MKLVILLGLGAIGASVLGCESAPTKASESTVANAPADNSKKNERDRNPAVLTPGDQGENDIDRGITQTIRQQVVKGDSFSMNAKNIKIITRDGVVTLRGPVKNEQERTDIGAIATRADGVKRVDNQLELAPN